MFRALFLHTHATANTPARLPVHVSLTSPVVAAFPHRLAGRPVHHRFRGLLSSLTLRPACSLSPSDLYTEGFSHFVTSMTVPIATGRAKEAGRVSAPAGKAPTLHGARRTPAAGLLPLVIRSEFPRWILFNDRAVWRPALKPALLASANCCRSQAVIRATGRVLDLPDAPRKQLGRNADSTCADSSAGNPGFQNMDMSR